MFKIICVTNRKLCKGDFLEQIEKIAKAKPDALILREKDLETDIYAALAGKVLGICEKEDVTFIAHNFPAAAIEAGAAHLHLPLSVLEATDTGYMAPFSHSLGVSCHSLEDADLAMQYQAAYITVGHIFETDCKKDIPPKGLDLIRKIADAYDMPVYAIGGINEDNIALTKEAGAAGACIMSGFMTAPDPEKLISDLRRKV